MLNDGRPFTARAARDLTGRRAYRLVAAGRAREMLRGVYVDVAAADTLALRAQAAALLLPADAVLCRGTVAWLGGIGDLRLPGSERSLPTIECVLPAGRTPVRRPGIRCYTAPMGSGDVVESHGLLRTSTLRTTLDLARLLPRPMALAALDGLASRGLVDAPRALSEIERFAGHRGVAQGRELLGLVEPLTESFGESWLRLRLHDAGFPRPTAQIPIRNARNHVLYRLDLGFEDARRGVEYDGDEHHGSPAEQLADARRRDHLRAGFGWEVVGFHRGHVWGPSLALEHAVGQLLGLEPQIGRRRW
ncbi:hypothetical protein [Angustibacter luteus]|uniref:DUF559 domain-containing protein n=1 Tax=Angustibacter luteus TaxID=658456 RepID=A0ABW1JEK1_9ACTN